MLGFHPLSAAPLSSLGLAVQLTAAAGSVAVTGQEAGWDRSVVSQPGAYAVTGKDAELDPSLFFRCQTGDFYLTGQNAAASRSIIHAAGSVATAGEAAVFRLSRASAVGAYTFTGQDATFVVGASVPGEAGTFTVTGAAARAGYRLYAEAARLGGSGSPQNPLSTVPLSTLGPAQPDGLTGFAIRGLGVGLRLSRGAGVGTYILTGYPVRFIKGPLIRSRGVDRSGPLVEVLEYSGARVRAVNRSGVLVLVRDESEGFP